MIQVQVTGSIPSSISEFVWTEKLPITRMYSSRMRTAHSSTLQGVDPCDTP